MAYCSEQFEVPFMEAAINPYDISKPCSAESLEKDLCVSFTFPNLFLLHASKSKLMLETKLVLLNFLDRRLFESTRYQIETRSG